MNTFGNALLIAMPVFSLLVVIEIVWARYVKNDDIYIIDTVSSLSSGMTNILKATLGLTIIVFSYPWFLDKLGLISWQDGSFWPYLVTFIFLDFLGYWVHRLTHSVNYFWNLHIIHHSSEEYNLPCALRQSISGITNLLSIGLLPLALLGIPEEVVLIVAPVHLFSQFWYHTKYIGKMGFLEHILMTPSHHRVHHAMNDLYLDKNLSPIFILWDKMFGTFQEELEEEPCVFGVRRPVGTWNPFIINFKHLWSLMQDAWRTKKWLDKLRIWFMPTGWRPADVVDKYPLFTISEMSELKKYRPQYSTRFKVFSVVHLLVTYALVSFLFYQFGSISETDILTYGVLLLAYIFAFTALLDKRWYGLVSSILVSFFIVGLCIGQGNWFGLNSFIPLGSSLVIFYAISFSIMGTIFYVNELSNSKYESQSTEMVVA